MQTFTFVFSCTDGYVLLIFFIHTLARSRPKEVIGYPLKDGSLPLGPIPMILQIHILKSI